MPFLSVSYTNFRNLKDTNINIAYPEIFLVGKNGQGKTNFLETLYISSYGNSFKAKAESQIPVNGNNEYSIRVLYKESDLVSHNISVIYKNGKKEILKNLKKINRHELINTIPCILFYNSDIDFITGEQSRKRFFWDQCLSMYDKSYISLLNTYTKILSSRNIVIKNGNSKLLDVYDIKFAPLAISITKKREEIINKFNKEFSNIYKEISGEDFINDEFKIYYKPMIKENNENDFLISLLEKRNYDLKMGTTMTGPHRDRIHFLKNNYPFEKQSSNGQKRLVSLVLRMLQAKFYKETFKRKPIILMDDVILELDPDKRNKFISLLPEYEQLICTFLQGEPFNNYKKEKTKTFFVENGILNERI